MTLKAKQKQESEEKRREKEKKAAQEKETGQGKKSEAGFDGRWYTDINERFAECACISSIGTGGVGGRQGGQLPPQKRC